MLKVDFNILHSKYKAEEIYIFDFIIIEFIKYIDEWFYNWIYNTVWYIFNWRPYQWWRIIISLEESIRNTIEDDYKWWSWVFSTLFPIHENSIACNNEKKISNPDKFDSYFSLIISWFSNTDFKDIINKLKNNQNKKEIIDDLNCNDFVQDFVNKIFYYIRECDYNNIEEINNIVLLICFLLNNESLLNNYSELLWWIEFDTSRCLFQFLNHFIRNPEKYKQYFKEIYNNITDYSQIFDYAYYNLNTDYELIKSQEKPHIYEKILSDHKAIWEKNIQELQELVKNKFEELITNNKLHEWKRWEDSMKVAIILWWITQKDCYNYLKNNVLCNQFIREIIFWSSSAYYKQNCSENDIDLFVRAWKLYFTKKQFVDCIDKYEWDEYEENILDKMIKKW